MSTLFYVRLVGFTAGALLTLLLLALIVGYRRRRGVERLLFFLALALFMFYAGALLTVNAAIHYVVPPRITLQFGMGLAGLGLAFLPPLLVHACAAYARASDGEARPGWVAAVVGLAYLPLVYFLLFALPSLLRQPSLERLWPGSGVASLYGVWLSAAQAGAVAWNLGFLRRAAEEHRALHRGLAVFFAAATVLTFSVYVLGLPHNAAWSEGLATAAMLAALVPILLLGDAILRRNFLQISVHRNLIYALSAAFLALLYLAVVRRVGTWLEPVIPPEATAAVLLFVLVFLFEPLQRRLGRTLRRTFRLQMDLLQRLTAEMQQEARHGHLARLLAFAERRIREEFSLARVRLVLSEPGANEVAATSLIGQVDGGSGWQRFALRQRQGSMGSLDAAAFGAAISGETSAALEFLAEQLPAAIDLCRLIEEKLKLERELAERERMALVGQMAASISHNLRNPLSSMKTILQARLEDPGLATELREDCALVVAEIDRLSAKLGQLLRYARPTVRPGASRQRIVVAILAEQVVGLLRHDAERRQVSLRLQRDGEQCAVLGSEEALSDVLSNLVVNGIEAVPPGGAVCVSLRRADGQLVLEVTDDGPGIARANQSKLLQPFFTTKPSGTGLGLAIVARRLAEMDGTISWESPVAAERGTRFTVRLPLAA